MKILVVLKQVPDSTTTIKIRPDKNDIERAGVKMVVNPFDEFAIEQAVLLKEKRSDVESVTALIVGAAQASEALRTALAVGADQGIHLQDDAFGGLDDIQTAALIAAVVKDGGYDLVLTGKQEIDLDSRPARSGFGRSSWASRTSGPRSSSPSPTTESRSSPIGVSRVPKRLWSYLCRHLLTCEKGLCEMRYPSLPNLMKAKKKPVQALKAADVAGWEAKTAGVGGMKLHNFEPPPERPPGKILAGEPEEAAKELVRLLREEAKAL